MVQPKNHIRRILILVVVLSALDLFFTNVHFSPFLPCQPFDSRYEAADLPSKEDLGKILSQKFTYLGSGHQCSVYLSEDSQYVIKFAQHLHFCWPSIAQTIPLPSFLHGRRQRILANQELQRSTFFLSAKRSFEHLKDECGLTYVHLNPSHHLNISLQIRDRFFRPFTLDLDRHVFIIQKKMQPITEALKECRRKKESEKIRNLIGQLVKNLADTMRKGYIDTDRTHFKNYGILDGRIACFDIGNILEDSRLETEDRFTAAMQKTLRKTRCRIAADFPEELAFFDQTLSEELARGPEKTVRY